MTEVFISISHTRELAVANAVAATPDVVPQRKERRDERATIAAEFRRARRILDDVDREGDV